MSHSPVPKFKTLKVALMCPPSLQKKYSQGNLQAITGGLVNYFMILANMVSPTFSRVCVVFYRKKTQRTHFSTLFPYFLEGGGHKERNFEVCFKVCHGFAAQDR